MSLNACMWYVKLLCDLSCCTTPVIFYHSFCFVVLNFSWVSSLKFAMKKNDFERLKSSRGKTRNGFVANTIRPFLFFLLLIEFWKQCFIYFGHKHVETGPNYSCELSTFIKYHMPLRLLANTYEIEMCNAFSLCNPCIFYCSAIRTLWMEISWFFY